MKHWMFKKFEAEYIYFMLLFPYCSLFCFLMFGIDDMNISFFIYCVAYIVVCCMRRCCTF